MYVLCSTNLSKFRSQHACQTLYCPKTVQNLAGLFGLELKSKRYYEVSYHYEVLWCRDEEIEEIFRQIDKNKNGKIDKRELQAFFKKHDRKFTAKQSGAAAAEKPIPRKIGQKFGTLAGPASSRDLIGRKSGPNNHDPVLAECRLSTPHLEGVKISRNLAYIKDLLTTADKNKDNKLSREEMREFIETLTCPKLKAKCQEFLEKQTEEVDLEELAAWLCHHGYKSMSDINGDKGADINRGALVATDVLPCFENLVQQQRQTDYGQPNTHKRRLVQTISGGSAYAVFYQENLESKNDAGYKRTKNDPDCLNSKVTTWFWLSGIRLAKFLNAFTPTMSHSDERTNTPFDELSDLSGDFNARVGSLELLHVFRSWLWRLALIKDSAMTIHVADTGYRIDVENMKVLKRELRFTPHPLIEEAVEITENYSVNKIDGVKLASLWKAVLDEPSCRVTVCDCRYT
ncbi:hypothetical protein CLF_103649 [Clonorchis sinensis]|uniref:EF-hand domain-containing protein n=1 Tax=Clonorchis sinensis TaxID=79923 RepID=G7YA43_CLOSI|nr:hypothetical protein CLF_103649 [Clonorchis sinensis]